MFLQWAMTTNFMLLTTGSLLLVLSLLSVGDMESQGQEKDEPGNRTQSERQVVLTEAGREYQISLKAKAYKRELQDLCRLGSQLVQSDGASVEVLIGTTESSIKKWIHMYRSSVKEWNVSWFVLGTITLNGTDTTVKRPDRNKTLCADSSAIFASNGVCAIQSYCPQNKPADLTLLLETGTSPWGKQNKMFVIFCLRKSWKSTQKCIRQQWKQQTKQERPWKSNRPH